MTLIDRDALIEDIIAARDNCGMGSVIASTLIRYVKRQETVKAMSVVHGKWIEEYENEPSFDGLSINRRKYVRCSICARSYYPNIRMRYCPNCGADMRGREGSND